MNSNKKPQTLPIHRRAVRLRTPLDVRRLLAKTINGVLTAEIEEGKGARIGYLCGIMLKTLELCEVEERIEKLERAMHVKGM